MELLEFQKKMAWVLRNDVVVAVPASSLVTGDTVVVHWGEMIPVDGEVLTGHATVDQKTITGESLPVSRSEGDVVYAATAWSSLWSATALTTPLPSPTPMSVSP